VKAKLVVVQGKPLGREVPLAMGRFLIGRGADCHLRPASELVSRHHCVLTVTADTIRVEDLGSTNGTLVNGRRIQSETELGHGDLLEIGPLAFALRMEEPAGAPAAVPTGPPEISSTEMDRADDVVIEGLLDDAQEDMGTTTVIITNEEPAAEKEPAAPEEQQEPPREDAEGKPPKPDEPEKKASASETATELMRKYYRHGRR